MAAILSSNPECEVIVAGGVVRGATGGIVGDGGGGFHPPVQGGHRAHRHLGGIEARWLARDFDYREVKVAQTIIEQAREVWLAADHSKFNRPAMVHQWRRSIRSGGCLRMHHRLNLFPLYCRRRCHLHRSCLNP